MIGGKSGFLRSGTTTPSRFDRLVFRVRALGLGLYPSRVAIFRIRATVAALTSGELFSALETVAGCTPAASATSRRVAIMHCSVSANARASRDSSVVLAARARGGAGG